MLEEENVVVAPSVLIFKKVDGKWMFDGEDYVLSMKAADELFGSIDGGDMRKDQPILEDFDFAGENGRWQGCGYQRLQRKGHAG